MAGASLLTLLDDIAALLDDVSVMTKLAAKKAAGVLGDDLALNAQQVAGVRADRELPVVWAVAKGSLLNKVVLVPVALLISFFMPALVVPLLMLGGAYLCFEGAEKVLHKLFDKEKVQQKRQVRLEALTDPAVDMLSFERSKIKGAIRTDFILSAEIIAITLGVVAAQSLLNQVLVLTGIAVAITVGVYGLVAVIVKIDDAGLYLTQQTNRLLYWVGRGLLKLAPRLMRMLSVFGTAAMFMVGGGILLHGIPSLNEQAYLWSERLIGLPLIGDSLVLLAPTLINALAGLVAGVLLFILIGIGARLWRALRS